MSKKIKLILMICSLTLIFCIFTNVNYAKNDTSNIENRIDYFFEKRSEIDSGNLDTIQDAKEIKSIRFNIDEKPSIKWMLRIVI